MPRRKRSFRLNFLHHVMFRGANGNILFHDDEDRVRFCSLLQASCEKHGIAIHGFCLMTNHIHLLLEPLKDTFSEGIHSFAFRYAQYFNHRHERKGYLFQSRFRSIYVNDDIYLMRLIRYIHLNPVEAFLTKSPENYSWSSYRAYLGYEQLTWLKTDRVLKQFGNTHADAINKLVAYTNLRLDAKFDSAMLSDSFRKDALGNEDSTIDVVIQSPIVKYNAQLTLTIFIDHICTFFNLHLRDLVGQNKTRICVDARSVLALFSRKSKLWSLENVGEVLGKNSGTISRLATRAENSPCLVEIVEKLKVHWQA